MKINKILLINPCLAFAKEINEVITYPPISLAYLGAFLIKYGFECEILDANLLKLSNETVVEKVKVSPPDIIGLTINIANAKESIDLAKKIKAELKIPIIAGGPFASSSYIYILKTGVIDVVIRNEGELTFLDLINNFSNFSKVQGISFLNYGKIISTPNRPLIKDLDKLPFPAYNLLPDLKFYHGRARRKPLGSILTSRGCPFQCIYCDKSVFGTSFRKRSPKNIIKEIDFLINNYGVKQIDILDDNFTLDTQRAEKILDMIIKKKYDLIFSFDNGLRADALTPSLIKKMAKAGVYKVGIGIESGDENILKVIKKSLDLKKVETAVRLFKKEGILVSGFFMIGLPYETPQTMQKTIDLAKRLDVDFANFAMVIPFPGTELYNLIKEKGKFTHSFEEGLDKGYYTINEGYFELGELKKEDILKYQKKAYKEFYLRPLKSLKLWTSIRSFEEVRWIFAVALPLLKSLFKFRRK
jgi:radical SAM superfamily enzyme YgiQ (UPF0313 family)